MVVRDLQISRTGEYCFGTAKECKKPECGYKEKCKKAKE
jgi:hypothetical protein